MSNMTAILAIAYRHWTINTVTKLVKCNHTNNVAILYVNFKNIIQYIANIYHDMQIQIILILYYTVHEDRLIENL